MLYRRSAALAAALASTLLLTTCSGGNPSGPSGGGDNNPPPLQTITIYAAGDIGECGYGALDTGKILDRLPGGYILALGDLAYMNGTAANFRDCYDPAWGRHIDRTRPVPGNHEYENQFRDGRDYFDYFGDLAGPRGLGYYAFNAGASSRSTARFPTAPAVRSSPGCERSSPATGPSAPWPTGIGRCSRPAPT